MKLKILGCYGGQLPGRNNTAFLLNGELLIDAGTIGLALSMSEQQKIRYAVLSHAHADHIGALPFFAVNIVSNKKHGVKIFGSSSVINAAKKHLMNNLLWPDFTRIQNFGGKPVFGYTVLKVGRWHKIGKYRVKLIPVNHPVPTTGIIIGQGSRYMLYSGDTADTDAIWREAKKLGSKLKALFIECSFPDKIGFLADASKHLVPATLAQQLAKLGPGFDAKVFAYHLKPEYIKEIKADLRKIKGYKVSAVEEKKTYTL